MLESPDLSKTAQIWMKRRQRRRLKTVFDLRNTYSNWIPIILNFIYGSGSENLQLKLRNGKYVLNGFGSRWFPFWLSYLLSSEWMLLESNKDYLFLKNQMGLFFKSRRKGADLGTLVEIFLDMPYGSNFEGQTIFDVGMSFGDSTIFFASHGAKKVIGIEPCLTTFELANENIKLNSLENKIITVNCAIGASEGKGIMNSSREDPTSNYVINDQIPQKTEVESVHILTIKQVMETVGVSKIDLLKMDCEGFEYDILRSLNSNIYSSISSIGLEFHNGLQDIPSILQKNGFILKKWGKKRGMLLAWKMNCFVASRSFSRVLKK